MKKNSERNTDKKHKLIRYKCATCGNTCLQEQRPDNSICGGCKNPDWKIMHEQQAYVIFEADWLHPDGQI